MTQIARDQLRSFVERVERIETEIKELNSDKSDIYAEAKSADFDVRALKAVVAYRRKDANDQHEFEAIFDTYMHALGIGTQYATRARAGESNSVATPQLPSLSGDSGAVTTPPVTAPPISDDLEIPGFLRRTEGASA